MPSTTAPSAAIPAATTATTQPTTAGAGGGGNLFQVSADDILVIPDSFTSVRNLLLLLLIDCGHYRWLSNNINNVVPEWLELVVA
jgi:hypothetical protein